MKEADWQEYCENGAKAIADENYIKKDRRRIALHHIPFRNSPCSMIMRSERKAALLSRCTFPKMQHIISPSPGKMLLKIKSALNSLSNPRWGHFYTSGRTSNEAAFLYQLLYANTEPITSPIAATLPRKQWRGVGRIIGDRQRIWSNSKKILRSRSDHDPGSKPGTNHPRMLTALQKGQIERSRHHILTPCLKQVWWIQQPANDQRGCWEWMGRSPIFFFTGKDQWRYGSAAGHRIIVASGRGDRRGKYLTRILLHKTEGHDAFVRHLKQQNPKALADMSGVDLDDLRQAASLLKDKERSLPAGQWGSQQKTAVTPSGRSSTCCWWRAASGNLAPAPALYADIATCRATVPWVSMKTFRNFSNAIKKFSFNSAPVNTGMM